MEVAFAGDYMQKRNPLSRISDRQARRCRLYWPLRPPWSPPEAKDIGWEDQGMIRLLLIVFSVAVLCTPPATASAAQSKPKCGGYTTKATCETDARCKWNSRALRCGLKIG
jgi:hypothetical protein